MSNIDNMNDMDNIQLESENKEFGYECEFMEETY